MQLRPTPPAIPKELLGRFGEPEAAFGPNRRFRVASFVLGLLLLLMGLAFLTFGVLGNAAGAQPRGPGGLLMLLGGGLMTLGMAAVLIPRSIPLNWLFVCPGGLIRTRENEWESVCWSDVTRFENPSLSTGTVAVLQCRITTTDGAEWGFLADWIADYGRLTSLLHRKMEEQLQREVTQV